jgi:hypothetical protein
MKLSRSFFYLNQPFPKQKWFRELKGKLLYGECGSRENGLFVKVRGNSLFVLLW